MTQLPFSDMLAAANAPLASADMNRTIGSGQPKFELYHFALSVCSQKVRACLAEKDATHIAHDINLQMPQLGNYNPNYVRLRMAGGSGRPFVGGYTGKSSTQTEGFDPAVVPTLVDLEEKQVYVDSVTICEHIDRACKGGTQLIPDGLAKFVKSEMAIVDATPHVAALYGAHPDVDFRPERIRNVMTGVHDRKIEKIRKARSLVNDDPVLAAAFDAKIEKEQAGKSFVATPDKMRQTVSDTVSIVAALDQRLGSDGRWVCGAAYTLADVFWAVSLFRLKWLGMAFCWEGGHALNDQPHPGVEDYAARLFERPSFQAAVIHWPGVPRSEYVSDHYSDDLP